MPHSVFEPPPPPEELLNSPLNFIVRRFYSLILFIRGPAYRLPRHQPPIRVVCISDTHNNKKYLPDGDLLIHAGDLANNGTAAEIQVQIDWLKGQPHREKIVIAGNHDSYLDPRSRKSEDQGKNLDWGNIHYLERSAVTLSFPDRGDRQLNVYGAPEIPQCGGSEFAFQHSPERDVWANTIPMQTDILVTHTPPKYHLDLPAALGCQFLLQEVWRVQPRLHVFGHVHAGHGQETAHWDETQRAYESIMARRHTWATFDVPDAFAWLDVLRLLCYSLQGILWSRVWGGANAGSLLVNASLSYRSTGKLANPVQVVEI
ncbi:MAG: hypothetical protein M1823_000512 [Watsoniomyces obsoletus]|nr:MAG: hypothetical protein M1823_000512 [Watsoniomyces obsoletus]